MKLFVWVVFTLFIKECYNWQFFYLGREKGGNIGKPHEFLTNNVKNYEMWFTQYLNHFNPNDERTWQQRYFVNSQFSNELRNVAFLMIGGEGEANAEWMEKGAWIDYAKTFQAMCFQLEHRYYGKSHPTEDLSEQNLQYLTSQQALADLAFFIESMNKKYNLSADVKWIVFGGSYPGSLAAWSRQLYPHLVHGAMSASGPLLAKLDFVEYYKTVADDLRSYSDECFKAVKTGTAQVELLTRHRLGQQNLNSLFKLCSPIENSINSTNDIALLFDGLASNFAGIAQYNKDNRIGSSKTNITIDTLCEIMTNQEIGPEVNRLAAVNNLILNSRKESCLDYNYNDMVNTMKNTSWNSKAVGGRQWMYQTCTEFGYYQTTDYKPQVFGDKCPLDFYIQQCEDIFSPEYKYKFLQNAVYRTNILYGGLNIQVSNVVFVHGTFDPWNNLGITKTLTNNAPAIFIKGAAHCANMYPPSEDDTPQLRAARIQIQQLIGSWLDF